jgi:hypothetical protein
MIIRAEDISVRSVQSLIGMFAHKLGEAKYTKYVQDFFVSLAELATPKYISLMLIRQA